MKIETMKDVQSADREYAYGVTLPLNVLMRQAALMK